MTLSLDPHLVSSLYLEKIETKNHYFSRGKKLPIIINHDFNFENRGLYLMSFTGTKLATGTRLVTRGKMIGKRKMIGGGQKIGDGRKSTDRGH